MRKYAGVAVLAFFSIYMFGCSKKEAPVEQSQESMSMTALSTMNTEVPLKPELANQTQAVKAPESQAATQVAQPAQPVPAEQAKLEPLPPAGPYNPTHQEIQTALKNAGLYTGPVDGKVGPETKKAIEEFQKANNLKADGKVGPKTWAALSKYVNPQPPQAPAKKKKR